MAKSRLFLIITAKAMKKSYACCDAEIHGLRLWNQYAAAMELAKISVLFHKSKTTPSFMAHAREEIKKAERRVLEVFK